MTLVEKLRDLEGGPYVEGVLKEAADRIEELEAALRAASFALGGPYSDEVQTTALIAVRKALTPAS